MAIATQVEAAIEEIGRAALEPERWDDALIAVARATGSHAAQLCALGPPDTLSFNRLPGICPDALDEWAARGFDHPAINSRVRIGMRAPVLQALDERAFTTEQDGIDCPEYGELIRRMDVPFICLTNLVATAQDHVGFAVLRTAAQGNIDGEHRRAFDHLSHHMQRAIGTARAINLREAAAIARGFDAIDVAAFVTDTFGRIVMMSAAAEALIAAEPRIQLSDKGLFDRRSGRDLTRLAVAAIADRDAIVRPLVISGEDHDMPLIVEFAPLPASTPGFPGAPGAIITLRTPWSRNTERIERLATPLYTLTPREASVAAGLCAGLTPLQVANGMAVGLGTIRTHIRHLFDKTGTHSLAQLVARLGAYQR